MQFMFQFSQEFNGMQSIFISWDLQFFRINFNFKLEYRHFVDRRCQKKLRNNIKTLSSSHINLLKKWFNSFTICHRFDLWYDRALSLMVANEIFVMNEIQSEMRIIHLRYCLNLNWSLSWMTMSSHSHPVDLADEYCSPSVKSLA